MSDWKKHFNQSQKLIPQIAQKLREGGGVKIAPTAENPFLHQEIANLKQENENLRLELLKASRKIDKWLGQIRKSKGA